MTLGTTFNNDPNFFINAAQAVEEVGAVPVLALGEAVDSGLGVELAVRLPSSAHLTERVDFAAVLPYCAAAIHHGGAGTTHALVTHAVPQIVVPHAADQSRQGIGVARTGCGYHMSPRQASTGNLTNALMQLLPDQSPIRVRAQSLQAEFGELGAIPAAIEAIEQVGVRHGLDVIRDE